MHYRPPSRSVRQSPPPLPASRPAGHVPWWLKPVGVVSLAVASVVLGAVGLPALHRPAARQAVPAVEVPQRVAWGPAVAAPPARPGVPPPGLLTPFDRPAVPPRTPSAGGPFALSAVIDREIDRGLRDAGVTPSPPSGDAEFFRRVHLDLIGRVPSLAATRAFLADADPVKRARVVDELLASPEHGRYLARLWADVLVKRDPENARPLKAGPFIDWLAGRLNGGAKWDAVVTEMVCAEGDLTGSPATFFIAANQDNKQPSPSKLTAAVGNLFLGVQVQCAECHRHPYHEKWSQDDFWGIAAFFGQTRFDRGAVAKLKKGGPLAVREVEAPARARPKLAKASKGRPADPVGLGINVPDPNDPRRVVKVARGRFLDGADPVPAARAPYRPALARWLTGRDSPYFARAAVNRYWAHFFARGLIDPIEEMQNPERATHPALLDALADAFRDSGHDLQFLFRAILNSNAYQRTSRPAGGNDADETLLARMPVKVMNAWQLVESLGTVTGSRFTAPRRGDAGDAAVRSLDAREVDDAATDFTYGIPQLLRLMNTPLTASSAALAAKVARQYGTDHAAGLEECFLAALTRKPRPEEVERLGRYVAARGPEKGYAGVLWALLNSAEFISNH